MNDQPIFGLSSYHELKLFLVHQNLMSTTTIAFDSAYLNQEDVDFGYEQCHKNEILPFLEESDRVPFSAKNKDYRYFWRFTPKKRVLKKFKSFLDDTGMLYKTQDLEKRVEKQPWLREFEGGRKEWQTRVVLLYHNPIQVAMTKNNLTLPENQVDPHTIEPYVREHHPSLWNRFVEENINP